MANDLYPDQAQALADLRSTVGQGVLRMVMQASTGWGKTRLAAAVVDGALRKGNKVAFVIDALSLIDQTVEMFYREGITEVGVIQADHRATDWSKPVQVCSIQTLSRRKQFPDAQVVVIDECHVLHTAHKAWLADPAFAKVPFIGLSATPWTKGLGKYFQTLIIASTTERLIEEKRLSPFRVYATGHPDLAGVKKVAGDYHEGQLSERMQNVELTADIISTWQKLWGKPKTLCFAVDCEHAKAIAARFTEAGVNAGYQDAYTSDQERREIKAKFHSGEMPIVVNIGTLTKGVDWDVRCIILARPTHSEILYVQIIGRGLRMAEGKDELLILDHSDNTQRLGFVTDIHHEHLDDGAGRGPKAEAKKPLPKECPKCTALVKRGITTCWNCGYVWKGKLSGVLEKDGHLIELDRRSTTRRFPAKELPADHWSYEERKGFMAQLKGYAEEKGYKSGWAVHKYKAKFGKLPWEDLVWKVPAEIAGTYVRQWCAAQWRATRDNRPIGPAPVVVSALQDGDDQDGTPPWEGEDQLAGRRWKQPQGEL